MTIKQAKRQRKLWYYLRRITTLGGTVAYILFNTGVFNDAVTTATVKSTVYIAGGWVVSVLILDMYKRAIEKDNPDIGELSRATAFRGMLPWIIVLVIAGAIKVGIANVFQHLLVISSLQIGGNIFKGYETKYALGLKRGKYKEKEEEVTDDVRMAT